MEILGLMVSILFSSEFFAGLFLLVFLYMFTNKDDSNESK